MYTIIIKNISGQTKIWCGKSFVDQEELVVPLDSNFTKWTQNEALLIAIANGEAQVGNGSQWFSDVNLGINWLKGTGNVDIPAFASKTLNVTGQKLYRRKHGVAGSSIAAESSGIISLVVPYAQAKIDKIEIIGGRVGDSVDLKVYDTPTGTISTVPNYMLNQFGFGVFVCDNFYVDKSNYDADLIQDMKIELTYHNNHATDAIVPYLNVVLHQVI